MLQDDWNWNEQTDNLANFLLSFGVPRAELVAEGLIQEDASDRVTHTKYLLHVITPATFYNAG